MTLQVSGRNVVDEVGKIVPLVGLSEFALLKRMFFYGTDGPTAFVEPIFKERRKVAEAAGWKGQIVVRVFRHANKEWNAFGVDPWSYDFQLITDLVNMAGDHGFIVDLTAGDYQYLFGGKDGPTGQQEHVNRTCAALTAARYGSIFQLSNEPFKNGCQVAPVDVPQWGNYLLDSGYYSEIQTWDRSQNLQIVSYHPGRGTGGIRPPKWLIDMDDQAAVLLSAFERPVKLEEPIGAAETAIDGRRANNPADFREMGELADQVGVYLHSDIGLTSDGYDGVPTQRACIEAFWDGVSDVLSPEH